MVSTATKTDWKNEAAELVQDFRRDGYVAIKGFISLEEISEMHKNLARFSSEIIPTMPPEHVFYEDKNDPDTLKQLQRMQEYDPYFGDWYSGRFQEIAETILEGKVSNQNMQYFNKPPGLGQPTPPHQDGYYFKIQPVEAVTMWLALEDVDAETGCVRYVRGSHLYGMRHHGRSKTLGFSQQIIDFGIPFDRENEIAFPASPGDLLIHHGLTIHHTDGNTSADRTRKALGFIYYRDDVEEDKEAHEAYAKQLAYEMANTGQI